MPIKIAFKFSGFDKAWNIFSHMTIEERLLLYKFGIEQPQQSTFVEIGSYLGASSCFLAAAAVKRKSVLHCVDTWYNDGMSEGKRDTWKEFQINTNCFRDAIIPHKGKSLDIANSFKEPIDLLFIDGDHSYEGCRSDVESWFPHLKPGGLIIMHDYGWAEGVQKVVQEFIKPLIIKEGKFPKLYWAWIK